MEREFFKVFEKYGIGYWEKPQCVCGEMTSLTVQCAQLDGSTNDNQTPLLN